MQTPTFSERLQWALDHSQRSQRDLGRALGVDFSTVHRWLKGSAPQRERVYTDIASALLVDAHWLRTGDGEAIRAEVEVAADAERSPRNLLRTARERAGLSYAQLARRTGYSAAVLEAIEEGSGRASERMIEAVVRELPGLSKEELMQGSDEPLILTEGGLEGTYGAKPRIDVPEGMQVRYVPLLSWAQAGTLDAGHLDEGYEYKGVAAFNVSDRRAFAVEIKGESMQPKIPEGARAVVCPSVAPKAGDTVIARTIHGDVLCKLYQPKNGGTIVVLSSWNPAFPPVEIAREEIAWLYPVKQITQDL